MDRTFIESRIPHRHPFLWIDQVLEVTEERIEAVKAIPEDLELFAGHYPHYPILPGVLLCEAVFQAGAVLISEQLHHNSSASDSHEPVVPVLTRIGGAKFKREVRPGDTITVTAEVEERLQAAWFMKGSVKVNGKLAVRVAFACALKKGD